MQKKRQKKGEDLIMDTKVNWINLDVHLALHYGSHSFLFGTV